MIFFCKLCKDNIYYTKIWFLILSFGSCLPNKNENQNNTAIVIPTNTIDQFYDTFRINNNQSIMYWLGSTIQTIHNGTIAVSSGYFILKQDSIVGGEISIDMNSIRNIDIHDETDKLEFETEIKSDQFFDVLNFPQAKLTLVNPTVTKDSAYNESREAILLIKDKHKSIQLKYKKGYANDALMITMAATKINRHDWNINPIELTDYLKDKYIQDTLVLYAKIIARK